MSKLLSISHNALRLTTLASYFEGVASGVLDKPLVDITCDETLFCKDKSILAFYKLHRKLQGNFDKHFFASVPYSQEQECRIGDALFRFLKKKSSPATLWCIDMAEATMARCLGMLGERDIKCLASTPTKANNICFHAYGRPENAFMYLGTWLDVTCDFLNSYSECIDFSHGFDVIIEDTSFQMYGSDRTAQIEYISRVLKNDGILILNEKLRNEDYDRHEYEKDWLFKSRFFSMDSIEKKKSLILDVMYDNQVSLDSLSNSLSLYFKAAVCVWNWGNFYTLVASNNVENLKDFVSCLTPPCIPKTSDWRRFPLPLFGVNQHELIFRKYES